VEVVQNNLVFWFIRYHLFMHEAGLNKIPTPKDAQLHSTVNSFAECLCLIEVCSEFTMLCFRVVLICPKTTWLSRGWEKQRRKQRLNYQHPFRYVLHLIRVPLQAMQQYRYLVILEINLICIVLDGHQLTIHYRGCQWSQTFGPEADSCQVWIPR